MAQARLSATRAALDMAEMQDLFNAERVATGKAVTSLASGIVSGALTIGSASSGPARSGLPSRWVCVGEPVDAALALAWQAAAAPADTEGGHQLWIDAATQAALIGRIATEQLPQPSETSLSRCCAFAIKLV